MAQLTVRNIDDDLVLALKARAAEAGRSSEAEHRLILREVLTASRDNASFFERAEQLRARLGAVSDTTVLIRADRDRDDA
jgi:plasmid stability protein